MYPILFKLGPLTLHTYGLLIGIGFLCAYAVARAEFKRRSLSDVLLEPIVFSLMIGGLFGARVLYFAVDKFSGLAADPLSFFRIWEGGLVFYGGALAGLLILEFYSTKKVIPYLMLTDIFSAPLLLGQSIGRLGCFAAGCCYGKPAHGWGGVTFTNPDSLAPLFVPLYPTQLYEAAGDFLLFLALLGWGRRLPRRGMLTAGSLIGYGVFRFFMEFLRGDDRGLVMAGLQPSQWIALAAVLGGFVLSLYVKKQTHA